MGPEALSRKVMQLGTLNWLSQLSGAEVKNKWNYSSSLMHLNCVGFNQTQE